MFSLRTARGRAIFGCAVLVVLFAGIAAGALWRVQDNQERDERLEHTSAAAVALEHARAQFYLEAAAASALMFVRDPALAERSRLAAAELGQDLSEARAEMIASGKADDLAALDVLIEQIDAIEAEIDAAMPFLLTADQETIATLASTRWPLIWPTIETTMDGLRDLAAAQEADLTADVAAQQRGTDIFRWFVVGLATFAFLVAAGVVALVVSVVRPLAALRTSARAITAGDLEARASVSGPEEVVSLARDFNEMTDSLAAMTKEYIDTTNLTGVVLLRTDKDNRVVFLNDAMCQFLGRPREEVLGTDIVSYLHPDDATSAAKAVQRMVGSKGLVTGVVTRYLTPMGIRVTEWSGHPIFDEQGHYAGLHGTGRDVTERKRAEEELRKSEERYRLLAENASDVIWTMDTNFRLTYVSPSIMALRGFSAEEAMAQTLEEMFTPASLKVAKKVIAAEQAIEGSDEKDLFRSRTVELEQLCKDGSTVWTEAKFVILRDSDGRPIGILGVTRDVTERKRAEEELRESEERLRILFEFAPDACYLHDLEGRFVDGNKAAEELSGYKREELIGRNLLESKLFPPAELPKAAATVARLVQGLPAGSDEFTLVRKDGKHVAVETRGFLVKIREEPLVLGIARDVTERKRAEEELRESEERFRGLAEATFEGIVIHDRGRILDANQVFANMFGYGLSEIIGVHVLDLAAPESRDLASQRIVSKSKEPFEVIGLRKDGSTLPCEVWGRALRYRGCKVTVVAVRDITRRKQAEEALQRAREEIESRVDRRVQQVNGYKLTFRELSVLHLVAAGQSDKEIAAVLGISPLTAHKHLANILDKMGASSRTEAGVRACREGLLD